MDAMGGAGMGTQLMGGIMQAIAASQAADEMFEEYQRELKRQGAFQREATQAFGGGVTGQGAGTYGKNLASGQAARQQDYSNMYQTPLAAFGTGLPADPRGRSTYDLMGQNRAALGAYQDASLQQSLSGIDTQRKLSDIVQQASGQAQNVFPYQMYNAQHAWDELAFQGAMIASIGGSAPQMSRFWGDNPSGTAWGGTGAGGTGTWGGYKPQWDSGYALGPSGYYDSSGMFNTVNPNQMPVNAGVVVG